MLAAPASALEAAAASAAPAAASAAPAAASVPIAASAVPAAASVPVAASAVPVAASAAPAAASARVQLKRKDVHSNTKKATKKLRGCATDAAKGAALTRLYEMSRSLIKEVLGATDTPVVSSPLVPSAAYYSPLPNATDINKVHCTGKTGMAQSLSLQSDVGTLPYRLFSHTSNTITCNAFRICSNS